MRAATHPLDPELIMAIAVTAEACGRTFTEPAARQFAADLAGHPRDKVLTALHRCRMEVKSFLTPAHVFERISDDRPGADEAWAIGLRGLDETETVVTTPDILAAMSAAQPVLEMGDEVGARMAFKDSYNRIVAEARAAARPIAWTPTLGWSAEKREGALLEAVATGRLAAPAVAGMLPAPQPKAGESDPEGLRKVREAVAQLVPASERIRRAREMASAAERERTADAKADAADRVSAYGASRGFPERDEIKSSAESAKKPHALSF